MKGDERGRGGGGRGGDDTTCSANRITSKQLDSCLPFLVTLGIDNPSSLYPLRLPVQFTYPFHPLPLSPPSPLPSRPLTRALGGLANIV